MNLPSLINLIEVNENLCTSGQPTGEQIRELAVLGFRSVINLATTQSQPHLENEAELVTSLGMAYYPIPVVWADPQVEDFAAFEERMQSLPPGKTLVHCAANYRATAFYGLYAQKHLGWTEEQADAFRAAVWDPKDFPAWEAFIKKIRQTLHNNK